MPNPVLQRELTAHLRSPQAFVLQGVFIVALGLVVALAWPEDRRLDLTNPGAARPLVELLMIAQFLLAGLVTPAFAAGALTGEKERKSYEMLLASALPPAAIVRGKWLAALLPSVLLVVSSAPLVMLCLPLGGVSFYEVAGAYILLLAALVSFSMISLFCSGYFAHTTAALTTSYLVVLPLSLAGATAWVLLGRNDSQTRLIMLLSTVPLGAAIVASVLFGMLTQRLWYPPDVGSEGKDVVDEQRELQSAVGLVIRRDEFPDRLFAPAKRETVLSDDVNPVLDKELRSELFSQGTLMLRLVLQISLFLTVPIMGACLYFNPSWMPWYVCYVIVFNLLAGPAFSAGGISSERERRTLDLLLVTTLTPSAILGGKLFSGLRVSGILTSLLLWPILLALILVPEYHANWATFVLQLALVSLTCLFTSTLSLYCSAAFLKSSTSLTASYISLAGLFLLTPAARFFAQTFFPMTMAADALHWAAATSPFAAAFSLPLGLKGEQDRPADWALFFSHIAFQALCITVLLRLMIRTFRRRYDAAGE